MSKKSWRTRRKEVVMKAKRWLAGYMAVAMLGMLATGCSSPMETEEEIIILKEEEDGNGGMAKGAGSGADKESEAGNLGEIAEQVQAPEHYAADFSAGNITVKVDAPVVIPAGEGFKTYRVKARPFEQEDYDRVNHVLLKDAGLWERDMDAMSASNGLTREEIEQWITQRESSIEEATALGEEAVKVYEAKIGKSIAVQQEEVEKMKSILVNALEEPVIVEVPAVVTVDTGAKQGRDEEAGWLLGYATMDGEDYAVSVHNVLKEDWRWNTFEVVKEDEGIGYFANYYSFSGLTDEQKEKAGFSVDEVRDKAVEAVAAMGFTDFVLSGEEYYAVYENEENFASIQDAVRRVAYGFHFTRSLEGIPVTYTVAPGTTMLDDGENVVWPYENLTLVCNEEGIVNFVWGNPYEVEKVSDEYLFLLPFAEIQNIFQEMIIKKYQDWLTNDGDMKIDFQIHEIRLGYMRVREKGNAQEATMVPVWDFFGTQKITYDDTESFADINPVLDSKITINALDGTIIDRESGY